MAAIRTLALALLAPLAAAQTPDAGPDATGVFGAPIQLDGAVANLSPLHYFVADGDHATENDFLEYQDGVGFTVVVQPQALDGTLYNWPSDMVDVQGTYYVIDTGKRQLYTLDVATSIATKIGPPRPAGQYDFVTCLAYDETNDVLWGVDALDKALISFNQGNGNVTLHLPYLTTFGMYTQIKGLAWNPADGLLYALDDATERLITIDPANGNQVTVVRSVPSPNERLYDEIQFFRGELYGMLRYQDASTNWNGQLRRIPLPLGVVEDVGPPVLDVSAHSLCIVSMPETYQWHQVAGPGTITFSDPTALDATADASLPGTYTLRLTVETDLGPVSDDVTLTFDPDVSFYCTGKTTSLGCVPYLTTSGVPSATASAPFWIEGNDFLPGEAGLLLYGADGAANLNFHGGKLCVKAPLTRIAPPKIADPTGAPPCTGFLRKNFVKSIQSGMDPRLSVGAQVNAQWRQRDPADPTGFGDSFSNGVQFVITP